MITKESIVFVDSHRDTHFTDSLVQYASEYEDLTISPGTAAAGAGRASCFVSSITLRTATNHAWAVSLHRTSTHSTLAATPYQPAQWIGFWPFTNTEALATATEFVYTVSGLRIAYRDDNDTGRLHVGLHNQSAATKAALGAALPSGVTSPQYVQVTIGLIGAA